MVVKDEGAGTTAAAHQLCHLTVASRDSVKNTRDEGGLVRKEPRRGMDVGLNEKTCGERNYKNEYIRML